MPIRQLADAGAQSTVALATTNSQTSVTLGSASGFPAILAGGQLSVTILDSGNPGYNPAAPLATPYEYQQVNAIAGNVLTFGPGGGAAARSSFAGTTPKAFFAGATVAAGWLAEDILASAPWKFDEQTPTGTSVTVPASGSIPASYLGINWRQLRVVITGRTALAAALDSIGLRFNGDTASNYTWSALAATAATPTGVLPTGATSIPVGQLPAASAPASLPGVIEIIIPEYASTGFLRIARSTIGAHGGGTNFEDAIFFGNWNSSVALTSFTVFASGAFVTPTRITTYLEP